MNINIRPATVEDVSEMAQLLKKSVDSLLPENYSPEQIKTITDWLNADFYRK